MALNFWEYVGIVVVVVFFKVGINPQIGLSPISHEKKFLTWKKSNAKIF